MASKFSILDARRIIYAQEDVSLPIKRSAWRLYKHEIERSDPKTKKPVSPKKALEKVLGWMLIQSEREVRAAYKLTAVQRRLLHLIVTEGFTQSQAALEMGLSHETVKRYCINLKRQLGLDSFYQVAGIAVFLGWIPAPAPPPVER